MRSQRKRNEYVFDDWASVHGRLQPWSEDQTTTHYESASMRYLQRQPTSNEPSFWQLDETLELVEEDDKNNEDNPFARARGRTRAWLLSSAAGSGLIAAVLFGRVLLYGGADAHAAPPPPPSAAIATPSIDTPAPAPAPPAVEAPQPQSASEVSHTPAPPTHPQHPSPNPSPTHSHTRSDSTARNDHAPLEQSPPPNATPGTLRINSRPWSQVFIDDHLIGNTPQLDIQLPAGSHKVRLTNPEFGMTKVFSVRVPAGETVTRVETLQE